MLSFKHFFFKLLQNFSVQESLDIEHMLAELVYPIIFFPLMQKINSLQKGLEKS